MPLSMTFLVYQRVIISREPGLIHPWLDRIGLFSNWILISKVLKYIRNIQNVFFTTDQILNEKVLFYSFNHVRAEKFFKNPKTDQISPFVQILKSARILSSTVQRVNKF